MNWEKPENRLALLELVVTGRLVHRQSQHEVWVWLDGLPWTRLTGRRHERALLPEHVSSARDAITRVWPGWQNVNFQLTAGGLPPTERGWIALQDLQRGSVQRELPARLNEKTAMAIVGPHSKASSTLARSNSLPNIEQTSDGVVRLRPSPGLQVRRGDLSYDASALASVLGEVIISERALRDGAVLAGQLPRAMLLVENQGAYVDVAVPPGWIVAHVPGWNTTSIQRLLASLPSVPVMHFGDLDPAGVRMFRHIQSFRPSVVWVIPEFWAEYLDAHAQVADWPKGLDFTGVPRFVRELAASRRWLEQEAIAVDPRLSTWMQDNLRPQAGQS